MVKTSKVIIKFESVGSVEAVIDYSENPKTAEAVLSNLPLEGRVETWGEEIYFEVPLRLEPENSRVKVSRGEIAYWPEGNCICIFFGKTPISPSAEDIRAYSPVNVFGRITGNLDLLRKVKSGNRVIIDKV
mgnify:CR=1 FL=1